MPETAAAQQAITWIAGLAACAFIANTVLGVAAKWRDLRAAPAAAETVTKADLAAGMADVKATLAELRAEMGQSRDAQRETLHALRDKLHEQQLHTALLEQALDNGIKRRVEQLEAKLARLEESPRAGEAHGPRGGKS